MEIIFNFDIYFQSKRMKFGFYFVLKDAILKRIDFESIKIVRGDFYFFFNFRFQTRLENSSNKLHQTRNWFYWTQRRKAIIKL